MADGVDYKQAGGDIPLVAVAATFCAALARNGRALLALAVLTGVVLVWCRAADLTIRGVPMLAAAAGVLLLIGTLWQAAAMLARGPAAADGSRLARAGEAIGAFGVWICFIAAVGVLSYLFARLALPLRDAALVAADRMLGFDWLRWAAFVDAHPTLATVFNWSYGTLRWQLVLTFVVAAMCSDPRRLDEFRWTAIVSALVTCVVSGLLPVIGAKPFFNLPGADWIADLTALRAAGPLSYDLLAMHGIVSLPSYHTALGVLFTWSTRRTGPIGWGVAALNVVMIASTLTEGGHYLVDVIAGLAVAAASIAVVRTMIAGPKPASGRQFA